MLTSYLNRAGTLSELARSKSCKSKMERRISRLKKIESFSAYTTPGTRVSNATNSSYLMNRPARFACFVFTAGKEQVAIQTVQCIIVYIMYSSTKYHQFE